MGLFDMLKGALNNADNISSVLKMLNGKIDVKSLATIFATYLMKSKLATSKSEADKEGSSFASKIGEAINLSQCSGIADVISKLQSSDKQGTTDLANQLAKAVDVIKMFGKKA